MLPFEAIHPDLVNETPEIVYRLASLILRKGLSLPPACFVGLFYLLECNLADEVETRVRLSSLDNRL